MTDEEDLAKVTERVRKLLALAEKNPNEAEATAAAAKAQELLVAYNLDMATVEQGGNSGKREESRQRGGMYIYERQLWRAVAELNFCLYFTHRHRTDRVRKYTYRTVYQFQHKVIGRTVNTAATKAMGGYLQQTIERLCRERLHGDHGDKVYTQFFSSWALAYREGIADRVIEKLQERRAHLIKEEKRKAEATAKAARAAGRQGTSTATALTISSVTKSEEEANTDFMMGEEGWSAKHAARRAARAAAEEAADREYAAWAEANPEEAKKKAVQEAEENRKYWARRQGGRRGGWDKESASDRRKDSGAYYAGYDAGAGVSIEPQVDRSEQKRLRG